MNIRTIALALLLVGAVGLVGGLITRSEATPLGQMDCGCGKGGAHCVTKQRSIDGGSMMVGVGLVLLSAGSVMGGIALRRKVPAHGG